MTLRFAPRLSLVPGMRERLVRIEAVTHPDMIRPHSLTLQPSIAIVISAFLWSVNVGCFTGRPMRPSYALHRAIRQDAGLRLQDWEISFPALPADAFRTLVWMAKSAECLGSGLILLSVLEIAAPELPRISRAQLEPLPPPEPLFHVTNAAQSEQDELRVVVTFAAPMSAAGFHTVKKLFEMWGVVLAFGGFAGAGLPFSLGMVCGVGHPRPEEVLAVIESFNGSAEAWNALLRGLCAIDAIEPIASVRIG